MKFAEHLSAHITPEWRKQYIQYEAFKEMLYAAQDQAPSIEVTDEDTVKRYYAKFEEKFFQTCEKELSKINTFYSEKLAEAQRRFATLQNELQSSLDAQRESNAPGLRNRRKTVFPLTHEERNKHRNIKDLKLAFSEFYLSLILLQNYQNLNFTGFRKILKKHDKILETSRGADWRVAHVEVAPFYTCKKITQLISETETLVTTELEGGDRQRAMKRLRVPPLGAAQPAPAWTTFRVGLYCGVFIVLVVSFILTGTIIYTYTTYIYYMDKNIGTSCLHVVVLGLLNLCFSLSFSLQIAGFLGVLWCISILSCLYADATGLPMQANPLILYGLMLLFLINPFKTAYYKSRFWLLKLLFRVFTAPFHRVEFADFWLADQLNSLVIVLMDLEYLVCYYSMELQWTEVDGLLPHSQDQDDVDAEAFFYLLILFSTISSLYTLIWDLKMDWGLFDRNAGEHTFLREEIVYPQKAYYYCAIVEDVILRFAWTLQISLTTMTNIPSIADILATVLAPMEVFRRFVWNFFRLENEHLNNCGEFRAVRDISVAPLNADDQTVLEQMMDQEDGVKHRQGKKSWKRSYSLSLRRPLLSSQAPAADGKLHKQDSNR
uniref:Xenotropic and polytropic retrovirus receptor 1a n=1 Tax=Astyanax mexicanus TaxID=7994 RepID=A0A8B9HE89_ASTMX